MNSGFVKQAHVFLAVHKGVWYKFLYYRPWALDGNFPMEGHVGKRRLTGMYAVLSGVYFWSTKWSKTGSERPVSPGLVVRIAILKGQAI